MAETDAWWHQALRQLETSQPYNLLKPQENAFVQDAPTGSPQEQEEAEEKIKSGPASDTSRQPAPEIGA